MACFSCFIPQKVSKTTYQDVVSHRALHKKYLPRPANHNINFFGCTYEDMVVLTPTLQQYNLRYEYAVFLFSFFFFNIEIYLFVLHNNVGRTKNQN